MQFDNTYARELPGFYTRVQPELSSQPKVAFFNSTLANQLRLDLDGLDKEVLADLFVGNSLPEGADPIAQAYAGHQFGYFNPQLGDGRALILGEVLDETGERFDLCFKGSGRTPYSRSGDGKAALGPMLREVLIGEAMHTLGAPTTRALAVTETGDWVYRDDDVPGAVLTRVASSHLRIGTFEYFAARKDSDKVKQLADYTIARHYREARSAENPYQALFGKVARRQAKLVAKWMSLGFIHGVMNTDNVSLAGETIDFGPCAFMERYYPQAVFSSIDKNGRYAFANQPSIMQWNLARFAESLLPLLAEDKDDAVALATETIESFEDDFHQDWLEEMAMKLGFSALKPVNEEKEQLIRQWLRLLEDKSVDYTLANRNLACVLEGKEKFLYKLFGSKSDEVKPWITKWQKSLKAEFEYPASEGWARKKVQELRRVNPLIIPRAYHVERALNSASQKADFQPFRQLLEAVRNPFEQTRKYEQFAVPSPAEFMGQYKTFCGT